MSVAIVLKSPLRGGNFEVGGDRKGTGLISPALCSGLATMSGTSSGDDSEPVPEVPTEVPSDLEGDVASGDGVPEPPGPTANPPSPAMTSAPVDAAAFPSSGAELEALAKKQRLMLDKAYRYLLDQGFGIPELASLDLDEVPAMARQLAEELAIPMGDWLEEALYCWLQEAQQEAKLYRRVSAMT